MAKRILCDFGRAVRRQLDERNETQTWLIEQVRKETGLYFDSSYLYRILVGKATPPRILGAIRRILKMPEDATPAGQGEQV